MEKLALENWSASRGVINARSGLYKGALKP